MAGSNALPSPDAALDDSRHSGASPVPLGSACAYARHPVVLRQVAAQSSRGRARSMPSWAAFATMPTTPMPKNAWLPQGVVVLVVIVVVMVVIVVVVVVVVTVVVVVVVVSS